MVRARLQRSDRSAATARRGRHLRHSGPAASPRTRAPILVSPFQPRPTSARVASQSTAKPRGGSDGRKPAAGSQSEGSRPDIDQGYDFCRGRANVRSDHRGRSGDRPRAGAGWPVRCRLPGRQGRRGRPDDRAGARHRDRLGRGRAGGAGADRPAHPRLVGRHLAQRAARAGGAALGRHHPGRCRQRRAGQLPRLSRIRDRALADPHPALSQHLVCRHLRVLQLRHGRRVQRRAPARCPCVPGGCRAPP